jgi:protein TonB
MKRYIGSFSLTLLIYLVLGFAFFYVFANDKIKINKPQIPKTISLNHIELKPQIEPKEEPKIVEIEKPLQKEIEPIIEEVKEEVIEEPMIEEVIEKEEPKKIEKIVEKPKPKEKKKIVKKVVKKQVKKKEKIKEIVVKKEKIIENKKPIDKIVKEVTQVQTAPTIEKKQVTQAVPKVDERKEYLSKHLAQIRSLINQNVNYPRRAKKLSIQGVVTARFRILENGTVENITIINGHKFLQKATIEAIENASKYFPKVTKSIEIQIPIEYKLI